MQAPTGLVAINEPLHIFLGWLGALPKVLCQLIIDHIVQLLPVRLPQVGAGLGKERQRVAAHLPVEFFKEGQGSEHVGQQKWDHRHSGTAW